MKKFILLKIIVVSGIFSVFGQDLNLTGWTEAEIRLANTCDTVSYMSQKEKEIVLLVNLVRLNGEKFFNTLVLPYIDSVFVKKTDPYLISLKTDLLKLKPLEMMIPMPDLYQEAEHHRKEMGNTGKVGHSTSSGVSFVKRYARLLKKYATVGENCQYGFQSPVLIVIDLLIDRNIKGVGHRKNILDPEFMYIGVSFGYHRKFKWNTVQSFGGKLIQ